MSVDMTDGNPNMDYEMHQNTYKFFINLVKYGTATVVAILILMAIFLI